MTSSRHALHIVRKDVRRLQWLLMAWIVILAGAAALTLAQARPALVGTTFGRIADDASFLLILVEVFAFVAVVSLLVHDDPLVGLDAFWLTRPIAPSALLAAKLTVAAAALVLLPLVAEAGTLAALSPDWADALRVPPGFVVMQSLWALALFALASLTPSLTRLIVAIVVGAVGALAILIGSSIVGALLPDVNLNPRAYDVSMMSDSTSSILVVAVLWCGALIATLYAFLRRRTRMGTAIVVATILIAVFVPDRWPWRFARAAEPDPGTWAHDTTRVFAAVEHDPPPHGYTSPYAGDQIDVAAPLRLEGVTPNYTVQQVRVESGLTFSDGQTFTSTSTQVHSVKRESEAPSPAVARLQAVLGPVRLLSAFDPVSEISMPVLLTLGRTSYERYGREAGRLTSTLDFYLLRTTLVGSLPVRAGAVLRVDKRWFMVVRLPPADQCCRILLRWFDTPPLLSPDADWNSYMFVLRNQRRGEAIVLKAEWVPAIKSVQFGSSAFGTIEKSERLVQSTLLHWEPIDREWLADADIAVVQTRYVGHVTRPLTVERFIMNAEN